MYELTEDQQSLREAARKFAFEVLAPAAETVEKLGEQMPQSLIKTMAELGFVGLDIPEVYGGQGFDTLTCAVIMEELAAGWFSAATYAMSMAAGPLLQAASEAQKQRILPPLCRGDVILTMALTETGAGSDASSISTFAALDGERYIVNGSKTFITNAHRADAIILFAKTSKDAPRGKGISLFLIEKGMKGFTVGQRFHTLAHGANPIWEVVLDHCEVPVANLIGSEGEGFSYIQKDFAKTRAVYGARCVGLAQTALDYALRHAQDRRQFGQSIASFQGIRFRIADILTKIEAARHLCYRACTLCDAGSPAAPAAAAMAKHFASDVAVEATSDAIQVMGGAGYTRDHPLERYYREAKLFQIGDGSSEVLRLLISRHANKAASQRMTSRLP